MAQRTLEELLAGRPEGPEVSAERIAERVRSSGRVLVVLDDDPTGTQSVADLPVLMSWSEESIAWALAQDRAALYVMTNTRSLGPEEAELRNREIARNALAAAARAGVDISFVSRSDSTLRGHFPLETDVLVEETSQATSYEVDAVLIVPAFGEAGRITVDGVHYARIEGSYVPVGETEFACDATFGYAASNLREWVAEKSEGRLRAADVVSIGLDMLRAAPDQVVDRFRSLAHAQPVVVDAVSENDLRLLAEAVLDAESAGTRLVFRVGPPFPRALIGQSPHAPLGPDDISVIREGGLAESARGGLVVVGSHVALSTTQLERLMARRDLTLLEVDVERVLGDSCSEHVAALCEEAARLLPDSDVVLSTSRGLVTGADGDTSLGIAREVSSAVVDVVRNVLEIRPPRFVVAKGGITASDVAARGLGIGRAMVRGPMLPGIISLWEPVAGPARGIPFVVFAGNVGDADSLADVVDKLAGRGRTDD